MASASCFSSSVPRSEPDSRSLLLATRSPDKAREIRDILGSAIGILTLDDAGLPASAAEDDIEVFDTFRENALAKASHFQRITGLPVLADDSGICADALNGRPGVRSRRFSRRSDLDGTDLDRANNAALLDALAGVPDQRRAVRYTCAAVFLAPANAPIFAIGTVRGQLLREARGAAGFGYDPLFLLPGLGLTFAQLDAATKHRLSHRGRAFRGLSVTLPRHHLLEG